MAMRSVCPVISMPNVPKTIIPTITTADKISIGTQYCAMMVGSTIMPTEMKNTEPKRSLIGTVTCSIFSAKLVPARIEPITNAPRAIENPQ